METQTWLILHYKFISAENITILSVSSDDFLHAFLEVAEQQRWKYSLYLKNKNKKKKKELFKFTGEDRGGQNLRCLKHRETGMGFLCRSTHPNLRTCRWSRSRCDFLNNLRS